MANSGHNLSLQSRFFPKALSALCLTTVFQFAACAQATPPQETAKAGEQAVAEPKATETLKTGETPNAAETKVTVPVVGSTSVTESPNQTAQPASLAASTSAAVITEPKVQMQHPAVNVPVKAHAQKLDECAFAAPNKNDRQAPRTFRASAYSIQGRTRSGTKTQPGTMAADPRVLPLGTVVQVNAGKYSGVYTVHDTGGAIKGNRVDVWLPSSSEARRFGRRPVKLVVLKYPGQNAPTPATSKQK